MASGINVRSCLAFGVPPRRRGWTRRGKLLSVGPERGLADFAKLEAGRGGEDDGEDGAEGG
eukprot:4870563-Pyramimonas_sp.AAC.1